MQEKLEKLGFSKNEALVFLALLEIGQTTTGAIIKKLGIHRNIVYEVLDKLEKRGLVVETTISGKKHFQVINPNKILDLEKERLSVAQSVVPELSKIQRKEKQEISVHQGIKEFKELRQNVFKESPKGSTIYILNALGKFYYEVTKKFITKLEDARIRKDITQKLLISTKDYKESFHNLKNLGIDQLKTEWRTMPKDFRSPASILMYLDKVIFQIIPEEDPTNPTAIVIKNKELAESYKAYFEMLWQQEVTVLRGKKDVYNSFYTMLDELKAGEEYCVLGANWGGQTKPFQFFLDYHAERLKRNVKARLLFVSGTEKEVNKYSKSYYNPLTEVKFLPQGIYEGIQINLYKNKIILFVWRETEPVAFIIEDKKIYETFKGYFNILWEQKVQIYKGREAIEIGDREMLSTGELCALGMGRKMTNQVYPDLSKKNKEERDKKGVNARFLVSEMDEKDEWFYKGPTTEYKILPKEYFSPVTTITYGNKVSFWIWSGKDFTLMIIDDKDLAESYKKNFDLLWNQKTRQYTGKEGISLVLDEFIKSGEDLHFLGSTGVMLERYPDLYEKQEKAREKQGLKKIELAIEKVRNTQYAKAPNMDIKYLPNEFGSLNVTWIFGNKFVNVVWTEPEIITIVEDQGIVDGFMKRFNYLWSIAKD